MKYLVLLLTLFVACQCGSAHKRVATMHSPARVALSFHGDIDFTPAERLVIAGAIANIEYQTAGFYRLSVVYDLNFQGRPEDMIGSPWLVRAQSTYPWLAVIEESRGTILGVTMRSKEMPPRCYLIADRLEDADLFKHVAMHELLHAGGLDDLGPPNSVMSGASSMPPRLCLSPADQAEFCRVQHCQVSQLNGCDW